MKTRQSYTGRVIFTLLTMAMIGFIFWNSTRNAEESSAMSQGVLQFFQNLLRGIGITPELTEHLIRKAGHATEFGLLGALLAATVRMYSPRPVRYLFFMMFIGLVTAVTDEYMQLFSAGRGSEVADVMLDFAGVIVGIFVCLLIVWLVDRRGSRKKRPKYRY